MTDVQLTPYLSPHDCAAAIAFYEKAFGAVETGARFTDPEGRIGHSEITLGGATLYLSDEFPDFGARSPQSLGGSSAALHIRVDDADETARRLVAAGAEVLHEVAEQADGASVGRSSSGAYWRTTIRPHLAARGVRRRNGDWHCRWRTRNRL